MQVSSPDKLNVHLVKIILLIIVCFVANRKTYSQEYKFVESCISAVGEYNYSGQVVSDQQSSFYYVERFSKEITFMGKIFKTNKDVDASSYDEVDLLLIKIDSSGNLKWVNQMSSVGRSNLSVDSEGNIMFSATFYKPNPRLNGKPLPYNGPVIIKFSAENGALSWVKAIGLEPIAMTLDASNFIYIAGNYSGEGSIDSLKIRASNYMSRNTSSDMFVAKLDPNGNAIWINRGGAKLDSSIHNLTVIANDIGINSKGEIYVTGQGIGPDNELTTKIYFDAISLDLKGYDGGYIAKLSNEGKFISVLGNFNRINNIEIDGQDNLLVSGTYIKSISNNLFSLNENNYKDCAYIANISPALKLNWVKKIKGSSNLSLIDLDIDRLGNSFITGGFSNDIQADNKSLSTANEQNFFAKIDFNGTIQFLKKIPTIVRGNYTLVTVSNSGLIGFTGQVKGIQAFGDYILEAGFNSTIFVAGAFRVADDGVLTANLLPFQKTKISTYPNPANSEITIKIPNLSENWSVSIFDQLGVLIKTKNVLEENEISVNISTLAEGLYVIKLVSNTQSITEKFTIRR